MPSLSAQYLVRTWRGRHPLCKQAKLREKGTTDNEWSKPHAAEAHSNIVECISNSVCAVCSSENAFVAGSIPCQDMAPGRGRSWKYVSLPYVRWPYTLPWLLLVTQQQCTEIQNQSQWRTYIACSSCTTLGFGTLDDMCTHFFSKDV